MKRLGPILFATLLVGCHSPGPYGHSRIYAPLSDETNALSGAKEYDPVMAEREPDKWKGKPVTVFGVVKSRKPGPSGTADLTLSVRTLEGRNLCESQDEDTCRVTVSEREHAVVHADVTLSGEDDIGKLSVGIGSLLRVVGKISDNVDPADGTPVIRGTYYRHWPRNYFVTTAERDQMRQ
jgi:hypothetical protein